MGEGGQLEFGRDEVDDDDHLGFVAVAPGTGLGGLDEGVDPFEQAVVEVVGVPGDDALGEREKPWEVVLSWESAPAGEVQCGDADLRRSVALDPACHHRPTGQPRS